jgi:hypothetical protein
MIVIDQCLGEQSAANVQFAVVPVGIQGVINVHVPAYTYESTTAAGLPGAEIAQHDQGRSAVGTRVDECIGNAKAPSDQESMNGLHGRRPHWQSVGESRRACQALND